MCNQLICRMYAMYAEWTRKNFLDYWTQIMFLVSLWSVVSLLIWRTMEKRLCSPCGGSLVKRNAFLSLRRRCATTGFSGGKMKRTTVRIFFLSFLSMYFYAFPLPNWEMEEKNFIVISFIRLPILKILIIGVASLRLLTMAIE